jgi:NACalpha-BTF3-like transcription factor
MEDCSICYEAVDKSTGHCTLACNHSFHINCLTTWTAKEPSCPLCRHELGEKEVAVKRQHVPATYLIHTAAQFHTSDIVIEDDAQPVPPVAASRKIRIGNGIEVLESDVACVMQNAGVSRSIAIQTLRRNEGDIVNSIMGLTEEPMTLLPPLPRPPHDIMREPSDDQTMKWALWRMFEGMRSGYQWNSYSDLRSRTKKFYGNEYWIHKDIHDICDDGAIARGYEST